MIRNRVESRSNEEYALRIQQGNNEAAPELWERVERLIFKLMSKYFPQCSKFNVDPDDLIQSGYFAMLRAVKDYDPDRGYQFTSYLSRHVDNVAKEELGLRGHKSRPKNVRSLDEPLPGVDESITLADTIPDEQAVAAFDNVERDVYTEQLHNALEECIVTLPEEQQDTIHARFYEGLTLKETAAHRGTSIEYARQTERKALCALRHPRNSKRFKAFRDDIIQTRAFRGVGWSAFTSAQASNVELTVERLERDREQFYRELLCGEVGGNELINAIELGKSHTRTRDHQAFSDTITRAEGGHHGQLYEWESELPEA